MAALLSPHMYRKTLLKLVYHLTVPPFCVIGWTAFPQHSQSITFFPTLQTEEDGAGLFNWELKLSLTFHGLWLICLNGGVKYIIKKADYVVDENQKICV